MGIMSKQMRHICAGGTLQIPFDRGLMVSDTLCLLILIRLQLQGLNQLQIHAEHLQLPSQVFVAAAAVDPDVTSVAS